MKSDNTNVTLGTPITINFPTTNSYQELNFKARMESLGRTATPGNDAGTGQLRTRLQVSGN